MLGFDWELLIYGFSILGVVILTNLSGKPLDEKKRSFI